MQFLSRIGRVDFIGIIPAGLYILFVLIVAAIAVTADTGADVRPIITPEQGLEHWYAIVVVLLLAYLLGSIPRAFPVDRTDGICCRVFWKSRCCRTLRKNTASRRRSSPSYFWGLRVIAGTFPYHSVLRATLHVLSRHGAIPGNLQMPVIPERNLPGAVTLFDFWKVTVCARSPDAFSFIQSLEGRVRLFVGIIWAGAFGVLGSLTALIGCGIRSDVGLWFCVSALTLTFSTVLVVLFGRRLRFVRAEEAVHVFLAFLALQAPRSVTDDGTPAGTESG